VPVSGIAFDAFGTLFDLEGLRPALGDELFDPFLARLVPWTWHATSAERYRPFPELAELALRSAARAAGVDLPDREAGGLAARLSALPAYPDVPECLDGLTPRWPLAVLSNGTRDGIEQLVAGAGLSERFAHRLSADEVRRFKPAPAVYALAAAAFGCASEDVLLVSSNEWDVAGAQQAGLRAAWVARGKPATGALGEEPDLVVDELADLPAALEAWDPPPAHRG